ncbi:unnamed protein product [[Candida] boidinii]|nr:unnamed protein product [[Candida] boidinii]
MMLKQMNTMTNERINDRDDLYPQSNKTNAIDERIVDTTAANNNGTAPLNPHQDIPDLAEALDDEVLPLSPEEEEQINRMKSVYKVYFSRENSMKSIKSKGEQQQQQFDSSNLPALPLHQLDNTNPANISNNNDNEMANGGISSVAPPQISVSHDDDDDNEENQDPMINNTAKNMSNNNGQHELRFKKVVLQIQEINILIILMNKFKICLLIKMNKTEITKIIKMVITMIIMDNIMK